MIYIYIYILNTSLEDYHRIPTYAEFTQEAVTHPTETIKYPNIIAAQLRNNPQLTRFDDEIVLDISSRNSKAIKKIIKQTAVQRALQSVARSVPTGLEQFDMADTEEAIQEQLDEGTVGEAASYTQHNKKQKNLGTINEGELAKQDKIDDMVALRDAAGSGSGSGSGSAPGSGHISDTAIVPIRPRTQSYEDQTSRNLRGSIEQPRWGGHTRKHSSSTIGSAAGAEEEELAAPINISTNIDVLIEAARYRISELRSRDTVADHQLVMEMRTIDSGIENLRSGSSESRTPQAVKLCTTLKKRLIQILNTPL